MPVRLPPRRASTSSKCAARKAENVDPEWKDVIPYNADDDRTCSEILTKKQPTARPEARFVKLPPYVEAGIRVFDIDNRSIQLGHQT